MPAERAWSNDRAKVARVLGFPPTTHIDTLLAEIERLRALVDQGTITVVVGDGIDCFTIARGSGEALPSVDYEVRAANVDVPESKRRVP